MVSRFPMATISLLVALPVWAVTKTVPFEAELLRQATQDARRFVNSLPNAHFQPTVKAPLSGKKYQHCPVTPVMTPATHSLENGLMRYRVKCPGLWSFLAQIELNITLSVIHSSRLMDRGTVLTVRDIQMIETAYTKLRDDYYTAPRQVVGMQLKRRLRSGKLINSRMLAEPDLVKKNDLVVIEAGTEQLKVAMPGIALQSGIANDLIRVRNRSSGKIIDAIVKAKGRVQIVN